MKKTQKKLAVAVLVSGGYGVTLHAVASELYHKAGYAEILSLQGEYIGMAVLAAGLILNAYFFWRKQK